MTHPFLTDPGTSQQQRIMQDLLSGDAQIDGRSLADLLDFFVQLSVHINYYNERMEVSDWKPFFEKSLPFTLAEIIKYDYSSIATLLKKQESNFNKKTTVYGLQLLLNTVYNQYIRHINQWHTQISNSGLNVEQVIEKVIKEKAVKPVKNFIQLANAATKWYGTKNFNFSTLQQNAVWNLSNTDLYAIDESFRKNANSPRKKLLTLYNQVLETGVLFPGLIRIINTSASLNLEQSLLPLKEELKQKNPPHLAVLFSFLRMFMLLQKDLNGFTKKHLDYFYKQVLQLQAKPAVADKVHVIGEIQKQLDTYLLKKGTLLKGSKDLNKAEILFSLDEEIVINKTQVVDQRTLFLNNIPYEQGHTFLEGVYMAPDATKANGIDKEFKNSSLSRAPLGGKWSKYTDPENKFIYPYPNARLGFILASPVLLLNEGKRIITISLVCKLTENYCDRLQSIPGTSNNCCDDTTPRGLSTNKKQRLGYPPFEPASQLMEEIRKLLARDLASKNPYYYVSRPLIAAAVKKGISKELEKMLYDLLIIRHVRDNKKRETDVLDEQICYCPKEEKIFDRVFSQEDVPEIDLSSDKFKGIILPQCVFNLQFSGEKSWIAPPDDLTIKIESGSKADEFKVVIETTLTSDMPSVTFYNAEVLKEELNTTLPLVKIELNDKLKLIRTFDTTEQQDCCQKKPEEKNQPVSLYHFFRNITLQKGTNIKVQVCGLKNLIVQNDESLQDVNAPIFAFGTRPKVGASFYIGSKEVFSKNWNDVYVNTEWKDRPKSFTKHYEHYAYTGFKFEDGSEKIVDGSFLLDAAVLNNGEWKKDGTRRLFKRNSDEPPLLPSEKEEKAADFCDKGAPAFNEDIYDYARNEFAAPYLYQRLADFTAPLLPLNVASRYGFIRLTLQGLDFQQDTYPFVLARQMMAYSNLVSPTVITLLVQSAREAWSLAKLLSVRLTTITNDITALSGKMTVLETKVTALVSSITLVSGGISAIKSKINSITTEWNKLDANLNQVVNGLNTSIENLNNYVDAVSAALNQTSPDVPLAKSQLILVVAELNDINDLMTDINDNFDTIDPLLTDLSTINGIETSMNTILGDAGDIKNAVTAIQDDLTAIKEQLTKDDASIIKLVVQSGSGDPNENPSNPFVFEDISKLGINRIAKEIEDRTKYVAGNLQADPKLKNGLPNEPYIPVIKSLSLDYTAISDDTDIDLIHLYPYAGTFKPESLQQEPTLFPTFCDEGSLFIGLKNLVPGSNLNILFQLAEATADSEAPTEKIKWHYLENNTWKLLRTGFEILNDDTHGLTTSGIIKFALPANMTSENTILPNGLHWIKASIPKNSSAVSEIISMHTQAVKATFTNEKENDKSRLDTPLTADTVNKLLEADAAVTKIIQPYESFGGAEPEENAHFYVRVSELLRHKNRAIQKFDYERLALELFPDLFKVKCINHTYFLNAHQFVKDFTVAPGYVMLAVLPDLNRLKAATSFEPKAPVSLLEEIRLRLQKLTSPFVRLKVVNPRYEKVNFCLRVKLLTGKDENYYNEQLKKDISEFLAPWAIGQYDKLTFGQPINRSDMVRFLEGLDYIDYLIELRMRHEDDEVHPIPVDQPEIRPLTPRSILIAGAIDVCIQQQDCEKWAEPGCKNEPYPINNYCRQLNGIKK